MSGERPMLAVDRRPGWRQSTSFVSMRRTKTGQKALPVGNWWPRRSIRGFALMGILAMNIVSFMTSTPDMTSPTCTSGRSLKADLRHQVDEPVLDALRLARLVLMSRTYRDEEAKRLAPPITPTHLGRRILVMLVRIPIVREVSSGGDRRGVYFLRSLCRSSRFLRSSPGGSNWTGG